MKSRSSSERRVNCRYFRWLVYPRPNGFYYADGRYDNPGYKLGRYSLETRDFSEAMKNVHDLDRHKAVELKLASPEILGKQSTGLPLERAIELYLKFVSRPRALRGAKKSTQKRYRAILNKFLAFAKSQGLSNWNQVNENIVADYTSWLEENGYAFRTISIETTTLLQVSNHLIKREKLLPESHRLHIPLKKAHGTNTFCPTFEQVTALLAYCRQRSDLQWLADVIHLLATTGLRISELSALRWDAISEDYSQLRVIDESNEGSLIEREDARSTKGGRSRSVPIQDDVRPIFERLALSRSSKTDGLIFHGSRGGKIKPDVVRNVLTRDVLKQVSAALPPEQRSGLTRCRVHSFRHYFCSEAAKAGVKETLLMIWMGHRDSEMVRHYVQLHDRDSRQQINQIRFVDSRSSAVSLPDMSSGVAGA